MKLRNPLSKFQADSLYEEKISRVSGQIDGGSPPVPAAEGAIYVCTSVGGVYQLNYLYRSTGSSWEEIPFFEGKLMVTTIDISGGTVEFLADQIYVWDLQGLQWVGGSAEVSFDMILTDDVTSQVLVDDVTGNVVVEA